MRVLLCVTLLLLCQKASSFPSSFDITNVNEDELKKIGIVKNNNYVQGSEQILNLYNVTVLNPSINVAIHIHNQTVVVPVPKPPQNETVPRAAHNETIPRPRHNETVEIPDDYILTPGIGAHKLHRTWKTWNEARNICISEGAHLAVITSAKEEVTISNYMVSQNVSAIWIGIHDSFETDDWVTVLNQPVRSLSYVNWKYRAPYQERDWHCALFDNEGMTNIPCSVSRQYFCKIIV